MIMKTTEPNTNIERPCHGDFDARRGDVAISGARGLLVGDQVAVDGRAIGASTIEAIWMRTDSIRAMEMARVRGACGRRLAVGVCSLSPARTGEIQRRAAAPLRPARAQEFDTSALPLFGDGAAQIDLMDLIGREG
jgi:hypothetical protein